MRYSVLVLCLLFDLSVYGQNDKKVWYNQVTVPPSPNAASLGKYGDFSVGKSTGTADVGIPIIAVDEGGISVAVSLSYQSSGLKVQERPSWVGLGWSLSGPGVITRSSRGLPDDHPNGFLRNLTDIPNAYAIYSDLGLPLLQQKVYNKLDLLSKNTIDYEPDSYSFNFSGHGGSFFFGNDGNVHCSEYSPLKFEPIYTNGKIVSWRVTDERGMIYTFGAVEYTFVNVAGEDIPEYISSWYLTKIFNPVSGVTVSFEYESYDFYNTSTYSPTKTYEKASSRWQLVSTDLSASNSANRSTKFVSKIKFPNQELTFTTLASQDNFRKLDKIVWSNKETQRTFNFAYDYFSACSNSPDCYRLKLLSLEEYSATNPKRHTFEYNEDRSFPKRESNAQDSWGYYNGATANRSLIPNVSYAGNTMGDGADRNPSFNHALLGTLAKITYPTKGYTEFTYQANTYKSSLRIADILDKHATKFLYETGTSFNTKVCKSSTIKLLGPAPDGETSNDAPGNEVYYIKYAYNIYISDANNYDPHKHIGELTITDVTAGTIIKKVTIKNLTSINDSIPPSKLPFGHTIVFDICAYGSVTTATAQVDLYQYDPDDLGAPIAREAAGVRILQISNYDPVSASTTYKTYDYGYGGYFVFFAPLYYSTFVARKVNEFEQVTDVPRLLVYSSTVGGMGASASPVAYETVREIQGTFTDNVGAVETTFMRANDLGHRGFPFAPQISQASIRSRIKEQKYFDRNNKPVRSESFVYDYKIVGSVKGFKVSRIQNTQMPNAPADYANEFAFENFTIYSNWYPLKSKTVKNFFEGSSVEQTTEYFYESTLHPYVTKEVTTNSQGEKIASSYKYPLDYTSCVNGCYEQYVAAIDACTSLQVQHSIDANNCASAYGECYSRFLTCLEGMERDIENTCYQGGTLSISCLATKRKEWQCATKLGFCSNTTYVPCLDELEDEYVLCEKNAFNAYKSCQLNFSDCLLTEYNAAPVVLDKSVDLLNLGNWISTPLESKKLVDETELERTSLLYTIEGDDIVSKPLQHVALLSYSQAPPDTLLKVKTYNLQGNPTMTKDRSGTVKMYIWGYSGLHVIAEVQSKKAGKVAYTSFEDSSNEGNWTFQLNASASGKTGNKSHQLNGSSLVCSGLSSSERYIVSFWAKAGVPVVSNVVASQDAAFDAADGWHFYKKVISGTTSVTISGSSSMLIDEVRLYPEGSLMNTYTHSIGLGTTSTTDSNNYTSYYEYDELGRLRSVKDFNGDIIKSFEYHFK